MEIYEWMDRDNLSNTALARLADVHYTCIGHILAGRRNPSPKLAIKFVELSKGAVPLIKALFPKPKPKRQ